MSDHATAPLLDAAVRIPDHIVFRSFAVETIVLNLETGTYHGLNQTAGAMLSALQKTGSTAGALSLLGETLPGAGDRLASDLERFCELAASRGIIEVEHA